MEKKGIIQEFHVVARDKPVSISRRLFRLLFHYIQEKVFFDFILDGIDMLSHRKVPPSRGSVLLLCWNRDTSSLFSILELNSFFSDCH